MLFHMKATAKTVVPFQVSSTWFTDSIDRAIWYLGKRDLGKVKALFSDLNAFYNVISLIRKHLKIMGSGPPDSSLFYPLKHLKNLDKSIKRAQPSSYLSPWILTFCLFIFYPR